MSSDKSGLPRFFVASKLKNMVKNIPNLSSKGKPSAPMNITRENDDDTIHSFHITESQQKPFMDCDALFSECEEFLKLSNRAIEANSAKGKSGLSKLVHSIPMSDNFSKWRSKKKENDLFENYEVIQNRISEMESTLSEIQEVSASSTSALITQSVHLNVRLTSCVDYNRQCVDKHKPLVLEGRLFLNKLKSMESSILAMMDFLEEINEQKRVEPKPYIPWALRQQYEDEAEAERKATLERKEIVELKKSSLERRLRKIKKIIVPVERLYNITEQQQHGRLNNLSHCLRSQLALLNFLHRCQTSNGSIAASISNPATAPSSGSMTKPAASPFNNASANANGSGNSAAVDTATKSLPSPPQSSPPAQSTAKMMGGFMNFANPIKAMQGKSQSAPVSTKSGGSSSSAGAGASATSYRPTLAELASGVVLPGGMRPSIGVEGRGSESSGRSSDAARVSGLVKAAAAGVENVSFDQDEENDEEDDDNMAQELDDPSNPDNAIEKAVRHMRVALTGLQRNSGLVMEKVPPYDHANCSDCAVVYDMANDCCMHIAAASFRSKQCNERQQRLHAYREKMRENAEFLDSQDPAGPSHSHSVDK